MPDGFFERARELLAPLRQDEFAGFAGGPATEEAVRETKWKLGWGMTRVWITDGERRCCDEDIRVGDTETFLIARATPSSVRKALGDE